VFIAAENVFDLACADIRVEQPNGELTVQRPVRSPQPRRRFVLSTKHRNSLSRHACDSIQAIGFDGV
jgi:hypothetical protein